MKIARVALSVVAVLLATSAAAQSGEPMYRYAWFSDASYETIVGGAQPSCTNRGITYRTYGMRTVFEQQELVGYCTNGRIEPE